MTMPSLFLPHGAPDLPLSGHTAAHFLQNLCKDLPRPKAIVIISAHWETFGVHMTTAEKLETIYDFNGFSPDLYRLKYNARTSIDLIKKIHNILDNAHIETVANRRRGLDHGAWVPLLLAFPKADIPIVQLSLDRKMNAHELFKFGQILGELRKDDILIIGSGATVHNLNFLAPERTPISHWAASFSDWLDKVIEEKDWLSLTNYSNAPHFKQAHPSPEHFLPLIIAAGAGLNDSAQKIHSSFSYGSIGMSAWKFGNTPNIEEI